ncbi:MAG: aminomethyl-transferring glycine dehydrogenase subunit GcvPA [Candidatus Gastranaerophilales bacterium]
MKNFLVHDDKTRTEMLTSINEASVDDLFRKIPLEAKMQELKLNEALSELETQKQIKKLANKNKTDYISFLGGGTYNKFIPACISQVAQRFEFLTAYTPYQAEISQGSLQIMYEFQTMICRLTGMDISNATVYDAATACAEALFMAVRISKKSKALIANSLNPEYIKTIKTYAHASEIELEFFDKIPTNADDYACVLVQTPNYNGEILEIKKPENTLLVVCTDVSTLSILNPPSTYEADIVIGDVQTLGIPMAFGGPHAGFVACREKFMRQIPGRLAGRTTDKEGNQAFCLTIQTREQHIKREKATSNICSNQALIGLCATLYLSLVGEKGLRQASYLSTKQAHSLATKLAQKGFEVKNENFFNEFTLKVDDADEFLNKLKKQNILAGIKLNQKEILIATTEMISDEDIELYINSL